MAQDEIFKTESVAPSPGEVLQNIGESAPAQHIANALDRAINAVTAAKDLPSGIAAGAGELYGGALNVTSDIAQTLGMDMSNVPEYTGESAGAFWRGLAGDEAAKETPVMTRGGEKTTLGHVKGYEQMGDIAEDVKKGVEGAAKAAGLGALTELWSKANQAAGTPVSHTANTLEQLLNVDNKRDI